MFLTPQELRGLTKRARKRLQIDWLTANGYPFDLNAAGEPVVLRAYVEKRLGMGTLTERKRKEPNFTPNLHKAA